MGGSWKQWEGHIVDGKFELRQWLGDADRSVVFLTEVGEGQRAAIKMVPNEGNPEAQLARWKQAGSVSHPHLIRLLQMGRGQLGDIDLLYVVMEYAEENLAQILPSRALTPTETSDMLETTLETLTELHRQGFVHSRLKPSNMMAVAEQLRLTSDGLVRIGETRNGLGAPSPYDAPEVASGKITPAADSWSLGMTLVEVLTQRLPRSGEQEPEVPPTLPQPFLDIVRNCLRRDTQARWSVEQIAARLHGVSATPEARPAKAAAPPAKTAAPPAAASPAVKVEAKAAAAKPPVAPSKSASKLGYMVPLALAALVLVGVLLAPRIFKQEGATPTSPAPAPVKEESQPALAEKPKETPAAAKKKPESKRASAQAAPTEAPAHPAAQTSTAGEGDIVQQITPEVPQRALNTIQGKVTVRVKVNVDAAGKVVGSEFISAGPSQYFAGQAMQAARNWKFAPAEGGTRQWTLRFEFHRGGTQVSAARVGR